MSKPSNRRSKTRKKRGRPAKSPKQAAVRRQLQSAIEAVEGLKGLETLSEAGPKLQEVYETVIGLAPIMDAVMEDQAALNEEVEMLKKLVHIFVQGIVDPHLLVRSQESMLKQLAEHMPSTLDENNTDE